MWVQVLEEAVRALELWLQTVKSSPHGPCEPLQEQVFLITEPCLQPHRVWVLVFDVCFCVVRSCLSRALLFRNVNYLELSWEPAAAITQSSVLMIPVWSHLSFSLHSPEVSTSDLIVLTTKASNTELHIWSQAGWHGTVLVSALLSTRMMLKPAPSRVHSRHSGHTGPQLELSMKTTWRKISTEQ